MSVGMTKRVTRRPMTRAIALKRARALGCPQSQQSMIRRWWSTKNHFAIARCPGITDVYATTMVSDEAFYASRLGPLDILHSRAELITSIPGYNAKVSIP